MDRVLGQLPASGFRSATLWVLAQNVRTIDFYAKAGWSPDGTQRMETIDSAAIPEIRLAIRL